MNTTSINSRVKASAKRYPRPITRKINLKVYRHVMNFTPFTDGNTQLKKAILPNGVCRLKLYLHGNLIGCIHIDEKKHTRWVTASDCGWATNVTTARLNAFLQAAGYGFINVCTIAETTYFMNPEKGTWFKDRFDSNDL